MNITISREEYKAEGLRRMKIRKEERKHKRILKKERYKSLRKATCRGCGEDPYCYCGEEGIPYSY